MKVSIRGCKTTGIADNSKDVKGRPAVPAGKYAAGWLVCRKENDQGM